MSIKDDMLNIFSGNNAAETSKTGLELATAQGYIFNPCDLDIYNINNKIYIGIKNREDDSLTILGDSEDDDLVLDDPKTILNNNLSNEKILGINLDDIIKNNEIGANFVEDCSYFQQERSTAFEFTRLNRSDIIKATQIARDISKNADLGGIYTDPSSHSQMWP